MMNTTKLFLLLALSATLSESSAQCDIKSRVTPEGALHYYIEPVRFYWTEAKALDGGVRTDKENYFLALLPTPFPAKPEGKKLDDALEVTLSNKQTYTLEHYDSRYIRNDTAFMMLFLIDKKLLEDFRQYDIEQVKINMGEEALRTYNFKLHKSAVREQLKCFMEQE